MAILRQGDAAVDGEHPFCAQSGELTGRQVRCGAGLPDARITRCHGRSDESVRMIQATMRGLDSSAAAARSPYVVTDPAGTEATSARTASTCASVMAAMSAQQV